MTDDRGALQAPTSHAQFPLFDSLRALAAISILVVHVVIVGSLPEEHWYERFLVHLDVGVPFFFLLSAFLLYRPFVAARVQGSEYGSLISYARRRFLRVVPAYWAALTIGGLVTSLAGAFSGNWWVYYGLFQNYPIYTREGTCAVNSFGCGIPPSWSLAIEVAFYVLLPFFALAMAALMRRSKSRNWLVPELTVVAAISVISIWIQSSIPVSDLDQWLFYSPLGRGWWFGLGLALAAISVRAAERDAGPFRAAIAGAHRWAELCAVGAIASYLLGCVLLEPGPGLAYPLGDKLEYLIQYVLAGVLAASLVLPAIFQRHDGGPYRRFLAHPVLTWLGLISYGIFLWQFPVMIGLVDLGLIDGLGAWDTPVLLVPTLVGTIICAALSYYLLELPLMRRFRSRRPPATPDTGGGVKPQLALGPDKPPSGRVPPRGPPRPGGGRQE